MVDKRNSGVLLTGIERVGGIWEDISGPSVVGYPSVRIRCDPKDGLIIFLTTFASIERKKGMTVNESYIEYLLEWPFLTFRRISEGKRGPYDTIKHLIRLLKI